MRIVGYVREAPGRSDPDSTFAQTERIRRWALDTGNDVVAICQDHRDSADPADRPGYRALIDIVRAGTADAVVLATITALSPDKIRQEIMLVDIRATGATVIATDEDSLAILADAGDDHARMVVRDVVAKVAEYRDAFGLAGDPSGSTIPSPVEEPETTDTRDVVVELIAPTG